jgi:hypothetical protein
MQVQEIEYVKNCVVKYLESNDEKVPLQILRLTVSRAGGRGFRVQGV